MTSTEPIVQRYDEKLVNFFMEEIYPQADDLYRLGFILTLNLDQARKCLNVAFKEISNDLVMVAKNADIAKLIVLKTFWRAFKKQNVSSVKGGQSPIALSFEGMSTNERVAVGMIDVIGLSLKEAKDVLELEENELRKHLASGRKRLMNSYKV